LKLESNAWWRLPQQVRFLVGGSYNTAFGYAVFAVLYLWLGRQISYLLIALMSYAVSVTSAFFVYRWLVFPSTGDLGWTFVRFNVSQLVALSLGMSGLYVLVERGHLNPLTAQACVMTMSVVITYSLHRYFSFRKRSSEGLPKRR
jgi:putative flippase GtrA